MINGFFALVSSLLLMTGGVSGDECFPKPLPFDEERRLLAEFANGSLEARNQLIEHNMRLIVHIVKKYNNYHDVEELLSVGSIGLIKAINTFKVDAGTQLATYAARCIENEILMVLRASKKHASTMSLYDTIGVDKDGNEMTYLDAYAVTDDDVIDKLETERFSKQLQELMKNTLTEREYQIICYRYGLNGTEAMAQREVAKLFGISRSYVSRIESKALSKIKNKYTNG